MPSNKKPTILLVEDNTANAMLYESYLSESFSVIMASTGQSALEVFEFNKPDLIVLDIQLPDINGLKLLQLVRSQDNDIPVIIITAHGSVDIALDAMKFGANDFVSKPFEKARLLVTVNNLLKGLKLTKLISNYEKSCERESYFRMIGSSLAMQSVYNIISSASTSKATVFITGESGTGKELCAEAIHESSDRKSHNFVAINCAAIPHDLLESEIFGHVKGAFTGASKSRDGAAVVAHKGTLFLDEIGEMPLSLQSKLLRFIQTGSFQPVGSNDEITKDIRFVCATNRDPLEEVRAGRFREDLYYRLHVIPIHMPSLRSRGQDIITIASNFLEQANKDESKHFTGFDEELTALFLEYTWPGNVRELSNVVRNMVILNDGHVLTKEMLPASFDRRIDNKSKESAGRPLTHHNHETFESNSPSPDQHLTNKEPLTKNNVEQLLSNANGINDVQDIAPLWLAEKNHIEEAIRRCNGNVPKAAAILEVSPSTIYRKKQQWADSSVS